MNDQKAEKLYHGITNVGDDLIQEAGIVQMPKRKKTASWRWGLVAACLCAALLGTAGAVQFLGVWVADATHNDMSGVEMGGGVEYYPLDSLSEEVRAWEGVGVTKSFSSWTEMEDFIGIKIMNNPVLDASPATHFGSMIDGVKGQFLAMISPGHYIRMLGCYEIDDINICVDAFLITERMEWDESFYGMYFSPNTELRKETYRTSGGLEAQIVLTEGTEADDICAGTFSVKGIPFVVKLYSDSNGDIETAREVLLQVLDGFQV